MEAAALFLNASSEAGDGGYNELETLMFADTNETVLQNDTGAEGVLLLPADPRPPAPPPPRHRGPFGGGPPPPIAIQLQHVLTLMQMYYTPSIIGIGFIGNFFAILICARSNLSKFSYVNYLMALYIADSCYLFNLLCLWLAENGVNIYKLGAWCHFVIFLSQSSSFLSLWYLTAFLLDRFISLQLHFWERTLCTTVKSKVIVIGFAMIAIAVFLNISLTVGVIIAPGPKVFCRPLRRFFHSWEILGRIDIFINCIFPYILALCILFVSFVSATKEGILCNRQRRTVMGPHRTPQPIQIYDSDLEKGRMCLFLSYAVLHLVLNLPSQLIRLVQTFTMWINPDAHVDYVRILWQKVFSHIANARPALNLFILLICYKGFRLAIKFLLIQTCKTLRKGWNNTCRNKDRRRNKNPVAVAKQRRRFGRLGFQETLGDSPDSDEDGVDIALTEVKVTDDISSE